MNKELNTDQIQNPYEMIQSETAYNLLSLNEMEKEKLAARIQHWGGLVRMFIHPMYEKWRGNEEKYIADPKKIKLVEIEKYLARLLAMSEEKTPPVIILEEKEYVEKLMAWLNSNPHGQSQEGTYFVETALNNPRPSIDNVGIDVAWDTLIKALDEVGVKRILMVGMQFEVYPWRKEQDWTGKDPFVDRCVGIAMSHLSKDKAGPFEVDLSALIDPSSERKAFNSFKRARHKKNM